jgi:hypothetical protein
MEDRSEGPPGTVNGKYVYSRIVPRKIDSAGSCAERVGKERIGKERRAT